jgi:hypothetical protein
MGMTPVLWQPTIINMINDKEIDKYFIFLSKTERQIQGAGRRGATPTAEQ